MPNGYDYVDEDGNHIYKGDEPETFDYQEHGYQDPNQPNDQENDDDPYQEDDDDE